MIFVINKGAKDMNNYETKGRDNPGGDQAGRNNTENAHREGLAKGVRATAIISLIVILAAAGITYMLYNRQHNEQLAQMASERTSFNEQLLVRDSTINDWLQTFTQIENNLNAIKQKENLITMGSSGDVEFTKARKEQILQDMKAINSLLDENRKKIASLNAQLKNSGRDIKSLKEMIAGLETKIQGYEKDIADLQNQLQDKNVEIGQLNLLASDLRSTVNEQNETISNQTEEMNKVFLASGTYKDLKEKGIVLKEGGFLGLGRTESLVSNISDTSFAQVDKSEFKQIPVNSREAKLVTEHPADSYEIVRETDDKIAYIEIKDPDQFWKISKYAVVELIR